MSTSTSFLHLFFFSLIALSGCVSLTERTAFDIRDYGARQEAKPAENAKAIQQAIDAAAAVGGRVVVPTGTWVSGTLWLKSHVDLHLEQGAVLQASDKLADYNREDAYPENFSFPLAEYWYGYHFIICREAEGASITGRGTIDGNGDIFFDEKPLPYCDWMKEGAVAWWNGIRWAKDKVNLRPGQLVVFVRSRDLLVEGITIRNSPCWSLFFHGCDGVTVRNYTVRNGMNDGNTDGIDIDCTRNVVLEDLDIDTGDDAVAIRCSPQKIGADIPRKTENVRIRRAKLNSTSSVFRIGVGAGEIRDMVIEDVTSTRGGTAVNMHAHFCFTDATPEGVDMSDITFRNCRFDDCREGYLVYTGGKLRYGIRDITFENCRFTPGAPCRIGAEEGCAFKPQNVAVK